MNAIVKKTDILPAINDDGVNAISEWCEEESSAFAPYLKFVKGEFQHGMEAEVLPLGTRLVPDMRQLRAGYIKWHDGEVLEQRIGLVAKREAVNREDLGDQDEKLWPRDQDGTATDPWQQVRTLPMKDPATGTEYVFTTSSQGGNRAMVMFIARWNRQYKDNIGKLPVMEIGSDSYPHRTYGKVYYPLFRLVGWETEKDLKNDKESDTAGFLNDEIPSLTGETS